jgi:hypothetical protein
MKDHVAEAAPIPPMATEASLYPREGEAPPKFKPHLMLVPAEATLAPGEGMRFAVRLYDQRGLFFNEVGVGGVPEGSPGSPQWTIDGVNGTVSSEGVFQAGSEDAYSAGTITLKMPMGEATARVRIGPAPPIIDNFDGMTVGSQPPGWIGVDLKTQLVEKDGSIVLQKLAKRPSAPYSRMRAFSGSPIDAGYTVQADLLGSPKPGRGSTLSDMGLINSRYLLILLATEKQVRLVSWGPIPRIQKDVAFDWQPDVWYRAKLSVDVKDGKGVVRAKVWPRDGEEPEAWTNEMIDPCPNESGSPGLYGYSKGTSAKREGAPIFYDNYRVTRND